ncbi:hypothetical protein Q0601_17615 [Paracoccus onubensis]|uniref:hypothetical protein n=1 Tax=Paracoccus onubensis TaxID=1675788 RepID=UPI00272FD3E9|nr:hypothetical protein [Paracoccus onubensis]MDP0929006.1 hypothetical protein [Paracoccus onubensis]
MASSVIGALRVNLGLNDAQFQRGMGSANSRLSRFAAMAGKIAAGLAASFGSAAVAMGASAMNAAAEVERLSQVAGTTPAQFQGWVAGAKTVGIEQEKLADILKDVNDRVGDFVQTGGGPMADFFEKIAPKVGVTADMFRDLSGADALQLYVSSLQKANVNQQDFTFYMEAMASDSTLLIPLLKNGGKAMAEYADRAEKMGAIMSNEMIGKLNEGKIAVSEMRMAVDGMRNTIGAQAVPAIKAMAAAVAGVAMFFHQHADTIADVMRTIAGTAAVVAAMFATRYAVALGVTAVKSMISAWQSMVALNMALGAQSLAAARAGAAVKLLSVALQGLRTALISTGIGAAVVAAGYLVGKFIELAGAAGGFGNAMTLLGEVAGLVWKGIQDSAQAIPPALSAVWLKVKSEFQRFISDLSYAWADFLTFFKVGLEAIGAVETANALATGPIASATKAGNDALDASATAAGNAAAKLAEAGAVVKDAFGPAIAKLGELNKVAEGTAAAAGAAQTYIGALNGAADAAGGAGRSSGNAASGVDKLGKSLDDASKNAETLGKRFGDTAADIITKSRNIGDVLKQLGRDLLASGLGSLFTNFLGGDGLTRALRGAGLNPTGGILSGLIPGFANGVRNFSGGLAEINERGGEIVDLPKGTRVIPHDVSMRMAEKAAQDSLNVAITMDPSTGALGAIVRNEAGKIIAEAAPSILAQVPEVMNNHDKRWRP